MGDFQHVAIVVTGNNVTELNLEEITNAFEKARMIFRSTFASVSPIGDVGVNGRMSFMVAPDGSKIGWPSHERAELARNEFVEYLKGTRRIRWVEVMVHDDFDEPRILRWG